MRKFEHRIETSNDWGGIGEQTLNVIGDEGWELIHIEYHKLEEQKPYRVYYFKKEKHDS